jgi:TolB-like protein/DNA-binding winged helix-turn-helix (wHTH) protein
VTSDQPNSSRNDLRNGFVLGPWLVLPLESRLCQGDEARRIPPKSMDVLLQLATAGGDVVERDSLLRAVWGERAVSDEPLTRCIGELRKALGDSPASPVFIETIPKRGYRLLKIAVPRSATPDAASDTVWSRNMVRVRRGAVAALLLLVAVLAEVSLERWLGDGNVSSDETEIVESSAVIENSIAVLPFVDMSAEQDQEYMGDGIAEEVLNLLARNANLRVISRSSSFSLKDTPIDIRSVAERFGVAYVLEGSVRTAGGRIRITAQLIDGQTGTHVWSRTYEQGLDDVFAIQDEIAASVVANLQLTLLGEAPKSRPTDPEAYALFLQGRSLHEQPSGDSMLRAIDYYEAALEIDPGYVPAWAWLAATYDDTVNSSPLGHDEAVRRARNAIKRALEIDPHDPLALGMDAILIAAWDESLPRAAARMQQALDRDPANPILLRWSGILLTYLGRHEDAVRVNEYLFERDPIGNITRINLAETYMNAGRFDDAVRICEIEVTLSSEDSPCGSRLIIANVYTGDVMAATALLERVHGSRVHTRLAPMVYYASGQDGEFEQALEALITAYEAGDHGLGYWIATTFALRGDTDAVFDWLRRSQATGLADFAPRSAFFSDFETDPRWQRLMADLDQSSADLDTIPFEVPILGVSP